LKSQLASEANVTKKFSFHFFTCGLRSKYFDYMYIIYRFEMVPLYLHQLQEQEKSGGGRGGRAMFYGEKAPMAFSSSHKK
jgi:hypothetical protein